VLLGGRIEPNLSKRGTERLAMLREVLLEFGPANTKVEIDGKRKSVADVRGMRAGWVLMRLVDPIPSNWSERPKAVVQIWYSSDCVSPSVE